MTLLRALVPFFLLCTFSTKLVAADPAPLAQLSSLAGEWEAKTRSGATVRVVYRLTSASSVLLQTWQPGSTRETVTVFHADNGRLMATHYCAQGNQPRLI